MTTKEFLRRVLPEGGRYCACVLNNGDFKQKFFDDYETLSNFVNKVSEYGLDTYYAISAFDEHGKRRQANVLSTKVFALDIDVGKAANSYETRKQALAAFGEFMRTSGLPAPVVVASGAGFHIYWVLTRALPPEEWVPKAQALGKFAASKGLIIDPVVTANSAVVLRPVGTTHQKTKREVKILFDAPDIDPDDLVIPEVAAPGKLSRLAAAMRVEYDFPPALGPIVEKKCQQIAWAVKNPSEVTEPMWYALLGVAAFTTEPEATAIRWSQGHPEYSEQNTLTKLEQWKARSDGPATCAKFDATRPGGCKGCPFAGKVGSPTRLGAQFEEIAAPVTAPDQIVHAVPIPKPFKRTASGIKVTLDDTDIDVAPFDIYPVSYGKDEVLGYEVVRYMWNRPRHGWTPLVMRQALLTDGHRDFAATIADQGIVLTSKRQTEIFQMLLRNYMDELRKVKNLSNLYASMGWKEDFAQFVIGDTVICLDDNGKAMQDTSSMSSTTNRLSNTDIFGTAGSLDTWVKGTRVLEIADMPWHVFALNMGFAAPLFAFGGLKGLTISLYGPTGAGKSLVQNWIQSIYGNPQRLHFAAKFTQNTLFSRLAYYCNLPMTIDEATLLDDKEIPEFLYWVTQGRDKARLNRNAEEREARQWATPVIVSTNKSLVSKLMSVGLDADAQVARLLELSIPAHKLFTRDSSAGKSIYEYVTTNYGHAGRAYLAKLVELGPEGVNQLISEARSRLRYSYRAVFAGQERYWEEAVVLAEAGGKLASDLGLIAYDHTRGIKWVLSQLGAVRKVAAEIRTDPFDLLAEYLNDSGDVSITLMQTGGNKPVLDTSRPLPKQIHVRYDLWRKEYSAPFTAGTLFIDRKHVRNWITKKGGDFRTWLSGLEYAGTVKQLSNDRVYLGKDTPIKLPQTYVLALDLSNQKFDGLLSDVDDALDAATGRKVKVVK